MLRFRLMVITLLGVLVTAVTNTSLAMDRISEGVYKVNFEQVDNLLGLPTNPDVRILLLDGHKSKAVSDSHIKVVRNWVEAGGVLWVAGSGLDSVLAKSVMPYRVEKFEYQKATTGKRGGELVVKGVSPRLVIEDHALTAGITELYLFPSAKFDGTQNALPLVRMSDTRGNTGLVLAAVPLGEGLLVLDGTARGDGLIFGRIPGFDDDHPNSLKQDKVWNSYDWDRLMVNAQSFTPR